MNRELHELNLEIQRVRGELGEILEHGKHIVENELAIKVSEKLDKLIVKYIRINRDSK